ncbi:MAG TPA: CHAT domain-containing protein, partial [Gemmatimonadales bacterium]|nr:CHAT domain-containing protein [Gemmatimonadales bacterium]
LRRTLVGPGRHLLTFFWGDSAVYGWYLTPTALRAARLGSADSLEALAEFLRATIAPGRSDSLWRGPARRMWERLIAPLDPDPTADLLVVSDGPLARVPLEVLLPPGDSRPWGATRRIVYAPSVAVALTLTQGDSTHPWTRAMLAVGNPRGRGPRTAASGVALAFRGTSDPAAPLPYGEEEVRALGDLFGTGRSDVLVAREATLRRWLALDPGRYQYLDFATHAQVSETRPELTRVVLADTSLDLSTIRRLHLTADLVTLDGCETGLGRRTRGEGVIGLSYAFLAAGARRTLVTLWRVDDRSAARFMTEFYRRLEGGDDPASALEAVRAEWIAGGGPPAHPSQWAPYVMVGADGERQSLASGR